MNLNDIKEELCVKFHEPLTLNLLTNYVIEFQKCFGENISTEEIINRLIQNINGNFIIEEKITSKSLNR